MTHQRSRYPVVTTAVAESEATLIAVPLLVDVWQVAGVAALDLVMTVVGAQLATGRAVLTGRHRRDEIERTGTEAVLGAGKSPYRADLDDVTGEVRVEVVTLISTNLGDGTALLQVDERISGDLVSEPGTTLTQHAALAV